MYFVQLRIAPQNPKTPSILINKLMDKPPTEEAKEKAEDQLEGSIAEKRQKVSEQDFKARKQEQEQTYPALQQPFPQPFFPVNQSQISFGQMPQ